MSIRIAQSKRVYRRDRKLEELEISTVLQCMNTQIFLFSERVFASTFSLNTIIVNCRLENRNSTDELKSNVDPIGS